MNITTGKKATRAAMFDAIGGWTTQFEIDGQKVGGTTEILTKDPRLLWHLEQIGGAKGKQVLELGPLEGAHTKMLIEAGAEDVYAVEGLSDCFLRCLVVKEAFNLEKAHFLFGDFNDLVNMYAEKMKVFDTVIPGLAKFHFVSAAGVLYHQKNPAKLIHDLGKITDTVLVWSQVASDGKPSTHVEKLSHNGFDYLGKINHYHGTRLKSESYCGGLEEWAFWFYPEHLRQCFRDAGFTKIIETPSPSNVNGDCLLFVATR